MRFKQLTPRPASQKYRAYNPVALTEAYNAVKERNIAVTRAARQYGIPEQTLRDRVLGKVDIDCVASGTPPLLTLDEEAKLVNHLKCMASYGYGYTRQEVVDIASDYAVQLGKRQSDKPFTINWFKRFIRRWPELRVLKPHALEQQRAKSASASVISSYFAELSEIIDKYGLQDKPHLIFNVDEKGVTQNHSPPHIVGDSAHPLQAVTSGKSLTTTILGCGSASGMAIPPFFVFAGKRMIPDLMTGASPGAACTLTETGWSNSAVFKEYLQDHFMKFIPQRDPEQHLLLLLDGHKSHVSVDLVEWAKERKIILFILPAHTSHILQPLDVACYGPFQNMYSSECHKLMKQTSTAITRYNICDISCRVYSRALSAENLHSAFRKTGIFPLSKDVISAESVKPAEVFRQDTPSAKTGLKTGTDADSDMDTQPYQDGSDDEIDHSAVVASPSAFMQKRVNTLIETKTQCEKKERKTVSRITSGKAITESGVEKKLIEHSFQQKSGNKLKKASKSKDKSSAKRIISERKGKNDRLKQTKKSESKSHKTSKISKDSRKCSDSPKPGPSHYNIQDSPYSLDSDGSLSDYEITESDKCCVCNLFTPEAHRKSAFIVFTKWVQCDGDSCNHWVHLGTCTKERVIRLGQKFYCPHCGQSTEE